MSGESGAGRRALVGARKGRLSGEICLDWPSRRCESPTLPNDKLFMFFLFAFWPIAVLAMVSSSFFYLCFGSLPIESSAEDRPSVLADSSSGVSVHGSLPVASDGMFLAAEDGHAIWEKTIKTVATDWPVIKTVPPDFESVPPELAGLSQRGYSCHSH